MEQPNEDDMDKYIKDRYRAAIDYYWSASKTNKRWYKITRILTIIVGALVTLVSSLSTSELITHEFLKTTLILVTPFWAFSLTIIAGFSQSFQWGSTWQNIILTAQQLQKEFDSYLVTPPKERKYQQETDKLNDFVINETDGFFQQMLGSGKVRNNITGTQKTKPRKNNSSN